MKYEDDWKCTVCGAHLRHDYSSELYWVVDEESDDEIDDKDEEDSEPDYSTSSYSTSTTNRNSPHNSSDNHRQDAEPRRQVYSQTTASKTQQAVPNKSKPQPPQKKKRVFLNILFYVNAFFLVVGLLNVFSGKNLSFLPTVTAFAILTVFFFVLSKTPKKSKRIFGKNSGMRKWLFILLCLVALQVLPRAVSTVLDLASTITTERSIQASSRYTSISSSDVNYVYDIVLTGEAVITDYVGEETSVSIPSELDGHPVIRIADRAFENCTSIESISMWADIDSIGNYAFVGCSNLQRISIPSSTKKIGAHAFENCTALSDVTFWNAGNIGEYAFAGCTALSNISIPSDTRKVGAHAFEGCTGITSLTIWEAETIDDYAFAGCTGFEHLSIPSETKTIGAHAFDGCVSLEDVTIWGDETTVHETVFDNCPKLEK